MHKINDHAVFQFNVLGEPFINKDIFRYLDYISDLGHRAQIITNISLMSEDIIEQLFKEHQNFVLVLSLQTPTEQSYVMRGYQKENFDTYKSRISKIVEAKFRYNNTSDIEIHVASTNHIFKNDSTFISDYDYNPWEIFPNEDTEKAWHKEYLNELDKLHNYIKTSIWS